MREIDEEVFDEQPLSEEDKKLVEEIYSRVDIFQQQNQKFYDEAKECRQILHMEDPEQDDPQTKAKNGKKTLQLQTLKSTFNNVVADQMLSQPEAKLLPERPDLQEYADQLQDLVHYVIYCANDYEYVHHQRCEDFYGPGTAITEIAWDEAMNYGRGEIGIFRWPIEAFLWDPYAENIQDCRAVMKASWHPLSWYREHWPEDGKYVVCDDGTHNDVGMTEGQEDTEHQDDEQRALLIEYWWRKYDAKKKKYTVNVAYVAGYALLEKQEDVYWHGMYPFVLDRHDKREGSLPGEGLVHELVTMMRYINRYMAYADMNARMSSKSRLLISQEAGVDMEAISDWENDIITSTNRVDPQSLQWLQSPPFNNTIVQLLTMLQSDLKADSGANQFTRGETTGGIVSGKAINSLIQAGGKIASMRTEQLKYGFKEIVEQVIWLMAQFYDKKRTIMITGANGRKPIEFDPAEFFGMKKGEVSPPPYTVQIEVSSRDPQRIANQNQMFMECYTMAAQAQQNFPLSSLIQILNLDGKDKILPIIQANEHYQEQMMQMQQQLEQMAQKLAQTQEENESLARTAQKATATVAGMNADTDGAVAPGVTKMAEAGGGPNTTNAIVESARNTLALPTGAALPT